VSECVSNRIGKKSFSGRQVEGERKIFFADLPIDSVLKWKMHRIGVRYIILLGNVWRSKDIHWWSKFSNVSKRSMKKATISDGQRFDNVCPNRSIPSQSIRRWGWMKVDRFQTLHWSIEQQKTLDGRYLSNASLSDNIYLRTSATRVDNLCVSPSIVSSKRTAIIETHIGIAFESRLSFIGWSARCRRYSDQW
jgi:hypothetical protein